MKLENIKQRIDNYFDSVSSEEVIERLKRYGYSFETIEEDEYEIFVASLNTFIDINVIATHFNKLSSKKIFSNTPNKPFECSSKSDKFDANAGESNYSLAA